MEREERRGGRVGMEGGPGTAVRIIHGNSARCNEQKQKYLLRRELLRRCSGEKEEEKGGRRCKTLQTACVSACGWWWWGVMVCFVLGICTRRSVSACSRDWVGLCPQPSSQLLDELHLHSEAHLCSAAVTRHLESSPAWPRRASPASRGGEPVQTFKPTP